MRFLFDQSTDRRLAPYLAELGHDVTVVSVDYPEALPDSDVLSVAASEQRTLVTEDRDFGELIFRLRQPHTGVIYLRLPPMELPDKLARLRSLLSRYPDQITDFVVVTAGRIRARP